MSSNDSTTRTSADLDRLVPEWLTVPETAEQLGVNVSRVRQYLRDGDLVAVGRGERDVLHIPAQFIAEGRVVKGLSGTLTLLHDAGYGPAEAVRWLFTVDAALAATPIAALREGRVRQVRWQAQVLGF